MIYIGKPYLKKLDKTVRLCSIVNYDNKDEEIWYEVDEEFSDYLTYERADCFLIAFLPYAMAFKHDIKIDASISEKLFYQLENYYIPSLSQYSNYYNKINIEFEGLDNTNYSKIGNGVGTGFSAGVDSFYSVLKHIDNIEKSFSLTHLTFFKVGATGSFGGEKANDIFVKRVNSFRDYAVKKNLKFLTVDSNISEHARMSFNYIHTFRSMSAVLALQKLFSVYYYSSTGSIDTFSFNAVDSANYDFFNLNNFCVEGMSLYSTGLESDRLKKQEYISKYEDTYHYLNVCNQEAYNCCKCEKCIRTMVGFHCLGVLDNYKDVFDLDYFYKNYSKCIGFLLGKSIDGTAEGSLDYSLIKSMKKKGKKIPVTAYIFAISTFFRSIAYRVARSIKPIRKLYHRKMSKELGCNYVD